MKKTFKILSAGFALTLLLSVFCSCGLAPKQSASEDRITLAESTTVAQTATSSPTNLGSKWNDYRFSMFGEIYELPMPCAQFMGKGWTLSQDSNVTEVDANNYRLAYFLKNNIKVRVYVSNFDVDKKAYTDCYIAAIVYENAEGNSTDFILPGEIKVGSSTYDDVVAAYGSDHSKKNDYGSEKYYMSYEAVEKGYDNCLELTFIKGSDVLYKVQYTHNTAPASFNASSADTAPFYNYVKPTQQSSNLDDGVFSYDGKLYQMPCPLSEFLDNGWTLDEDQPTDTTVAAGSYKHISLSYKQDYSSTYGSYGKFGYCIYADATNTSSKANILKNCLITEIEFETDDADTLSEFASRIGFAFPISTKENIEAAKTEKKISFDYSSSTKDGASYDYYMYKPQDKLVKYQFSYYNGKLFSLTCRYTESNY